MADIVIRNLNLISVKEGPDPNSLVLSGRAHHGGMGSPGTAGDLFVFALTHRPFPFCCLCAAMVVVLYAANGWVDGKQE